ncbi:hypothetical protein BH11BAC4_BH11BAC4_01730 [soil metagenome]
MPAPNSYEINNTLGAFHGTWQWVSGTDTVKIFLTTKKVHIQEDNYDVDLLVGWHIYKKGSVVVESSYQHIDNVNYRSITLWDDGTAYSTKLQGGINDLTKYPKYNMLYVTLNSAHTQLTWRCTEWGGRVYSAGETVPAAGVTLPRNMVLVKQ